jgi:hypothetical protein
VGNGATAVAAGVLPSDELTTSRAGPAEPEARGCRAVEGTDVTPIYSAASPPTNNRATAASTSSRNGLQREGGIGASGPPEGTRQALGLALLGAARADTRRATLALDGARSTLGNASAQAQRRRR